MRLAFITDDMHPWENGLIPGGSAYYRQALPMNFFKPNVRMGRPVWSAEDGFGVFAYEGHAQFGFDIVYMKMLISRWIPEQMDRARALGQRFLVDMDDHYDGLVEDNLAYHTTHPDKNKVNNREHLRKIIERADVITVSTPFLLDYYKQVNEKTYLIRNGINPNQFNRHRHTAAVKPRLGWVGAVGWRTGDIETLQDWLPDFLEQHDLEIVHGGVMPDQPSFAELSGVNPERCISLPMMPITLYQELMQFDIGLVPLRLHDFNEAKSNLKGLEYAAANIPFVAAPTGEYKYLANCGVGRIASTPDEWRQHVTELLDYTTRKQEAARQRALVLEEHSVNARAMQWAEAFSQLVGPPARINNSLQRYVLV